MTTAWLAAPLCTLVLASALAADARWVRFLPMDPPGGTRKRHGRPLPMVGGVVGVSACALLLALASPLAALGAALCTAIGWADDRAKERRADLRAATKAVVLTAAAVVAVAALKPAPRSLATWLLAVAVAFMVINALNFLDNTDGVAAAVGGAGLLLAAGERALPVALGSLFLGFLPFNWPRPRALLGDAGSLSLGYCLAFVALERGVAADTVSWPALLAPVAVPVLDFVQVVCARVWLGFSPWTGDRRHLTHVALYAGLPSVLVAPLFVGLVVGLYAALGP